MHKHLIPILLLLLLAPSLATAQQDPASFVDPFIGTGGHGHTFPGATVPFGMVQCSPDAGKSGWDWCSGYHASDSALIGFSHTHLSGTGCADLGDILLLPALHTDALDRGFRATYDHAHEEGQPGYYRVLLDNDIEVELTATLRCGVQHYTYPSSDSLLLILDLGYGQDDRATECHVMVVSDTLITGYRYSTGWAVRQRVYFAMAFSRPIQQWYETSAGWAAPTGDATGRQLLTAFYFGFAGEGDDLLVRTAISPVSAEGALANLRAEAPHQFFESYRSEARRAWNRELGRIRIDAQSEAQRRTFMTALYHCMIAPSRYQDVDGRYRGGDDEVHRADFAHSTVFSLWDTYRALHPLFTIIDPARVTGWIRSMLAFHDESGLLPVWTLHANETNCMIGYHAVPVIADAFLKGIGGFSGEEALAAMKNSAEQTKGGLRYYQSEELRTLADVEQENDIRSARYDFPWDDVGTVVNGYAASIEGATIDYHSSVPGVNQALITRATAESAPIAWRSEHLPSQLTGDAVVFVWQAGMSVAKGGNRFQLTINDAYSIVFNTPGAAGADGIAATGSGMELRFAAAMADEFGDLFGTMLMKVPVKLISPGAPVRFRLEGADAGSSDWVMTFTHAFSHSCEAVNGHGIAQDNGVDLQFARLQYAYIGLPRDLTLEGDAGYMQSVRVWPGFNSALIPMRRREREDTGSIRVTQPGGDILMREVLLRPATAPRCIPSDVESESVSKTLEYAYDDWCIARVAEALGREEEAARYDERAGYYRTLFDADLGFMRGRNLDGSWRSPFNPRYSTLKQHEYTEGNAWQYSWYVPHDVAGLIALHGGVRPFAAKLDSLFEQSSDLEGTGATGDVTGLIGLYAHGNEPSHHIAYLYNHAGQAWKAQALVRRIMREMYSDQRDGLSGNEDCGQMSAWYVLSAMGLYPLNPCGGVYEIGSPALHRAEIMLEGGRSFVVTAENNSSENVYVQSATLNGTALAAPRIMHEDVMRGGELTLRMGPQPSKLWNEGG